MPLSGLFDTRLVGAVVVPALLLAVLAIGAPGPLVAVRPVNPETGQVILNNPTDVNATGQHQKFAVGSFDAADYVDNLWQAKVVPWAADHATDMGKLLSALGADPAHAAQQYGVRSGGDSYSFLVRGRARVAAVDMSTPVGKVKLTNPSWEKQAVALYAGPLVFGTALRDAFPFLSLNNFTNQVQYASVGKSMNTRALEQAYAGLDVQQLEGKTIEFTGAFAEMAGGSINIVPLSVRAGS